MFWSNEIESFEELNSQFCEAMGWEGKKVRNLIGEMNESIADNIFNFGDNGNNISD